MRAGEDAQATITNTYTSLTGSLTVTKTIAGPAAGLQGQVTIKVSCDGTELLPELTVDARAPADNYTHTYSDIPAGSTCSAEETADGSTGTIDVAVSGDIGTSVTVPAGGTAPLHITDTYTHATGSLLVTKLIDGPAAGSQGEVEISVSCGGAALSDFVIPAGATGLSEQTYDDIPVGSTCTVSEVTDGASNAVSVTTVVHQPVPIAAGQEVTADITNTYDFVPGSLTVTKTITGYGRRSAGSGHDHRHLRVRQHRDDAFAAFRHPGGRHGGSHLHLPRHPGRVDLHRAGGPRR